MISQERVMQAALITAATGVILLAFLAEQSQASETKIGSIEKSLEGKAVKISARVTSLRKANSLLILEIYDGTGQIEAVISSEKNTQGIKKNTYWDFEGTIQTYDGRLQLAVKKAEKWV